MNTEKIKVGFAGMTHLGINHAIATAERGFEVLGFDFDKSLIEDLSIGKFPISEPTLKQFYSSNKEKLSFSSESNDIERCDLIFISVDVPTNDYGESDLTPIKKMISSVKEKMKSRSTLIILCQVPPGFTRGVNFIDDYLFYQVETLIFGRAIDRALNPERTIVGCNDPLKKLPSNYLKYLESFNCPILKMKYESAELAKISINFCLVSSVTTANVLAEVCEKIGADWGEIIPALKLDKRIGQYAYLKPGLGISGGNLERDLKTILTLGEKYSLNKNVINSWIENSMERKNWILDKLNQVILEKKPDSIISVLGLAYKENTNSIKNSPSLNMINKLNKKNVKVHDPVVTKKNVPDLSFYSEIDSCLKEADVVVIATAWDEYKKNITPGLLTRLMRGKVVIDPYRVLNREIFCRAGFEIHNIGRSLN